MSSAMDLRRAVTPPDLLKVMVVRGIVFIEEQRVDWADEIDEFEDVATHFLGEVEGQPVATGRLRVLADDRTKIERIAVRSAWRGRGYAREMVQYVLDYAMAAGARRLVMHAQVHLEKFYTEFGFRRQGDIFDECGIDHITMVREDD